MFARTVVCVGMAGALLMTAPMGADAGGLFGSGGVFRGTVGNWLDKHVEQPILTPAARTAVVVAATAGAVAIGGAVAAPVGATIGNGINESFAGGKRAESPQQSQQQAAMGSNCSTEVVGVFPLSGPAPLGSSCNIKLQNGKEFGGKVTQ